MSEYVVLIPGNEAAWAAAPEDERQRMYGRHAEFSRLLEERGHKVTKGSELAPSREAKTLRRGSDGHLSVTDGPYTETVEQLTGFYVIESDDLDDLLEVCQVLAEAESVIEVRPAAHGSA
jgi:hypothetical protein